MPIYNAVCVSCGADYNKAERRGKPGRAVVCNECGEEGETTVKYTGVMVYDHKTSAQIQVNSNPALTEYLINSTKLKNKGSNMTNNIANCTKYKNLAKTEGACVHTADAFNYKNRDGI
jgi:hypothetical protein